MFPAGYEPFYRAICAMPADDAPRLVFADWLDEHDDHDRAAFIRQHIALCRANEQGTDTAELVEHLRPLRLLAETVWRPPLTALRGVSWHRYWRGFVSGADFHSAFWFFKQSAAAFETVPIQFMRIHGLRPAHAAKLAASPVLERIEHLTLLGLPYLLEDVGWRAVVQSPHLQHLRALHINNAPFHRRYASHSFLALSDRAARGLTESPMLQNLEELRIVGVVSPQAEKLFRDRFGEGFQYHVRRG